MNTIKTIEAIREHLVLLGKELEFASGIRALAAEKIMSEQGITDPDDLFQTCEEMVGSPAVFESYDDPLNTKPSDLVLGQGCPSRLLRLTSRCGPITGTIGSCTL